MQRSARALTGACRPHTRTNVDYIALADERGHHPRSFGGYYLMPPTAKFYVLLILSAWIVGELCWIWEVKFPWNVIAGATTGLLFGAAWRWDHRPEKPKPKKGPWG